jgi:transcriptional regulator with XRE-family HTH domain
MDTQFWRREFRRRLAYYLERSGMTQIRLAHAIGVNRASISAYLSGTQVPSVKSLINMARVFGCHVSDLLGNLK